MFTQSKFAVKSGPVPEPLPKLVNMDMGEAAPTGLNPSVCMSTRFGGGRLNSIPMKALLLVFENGLKPVLKSGKPSVGTKPGPMAGV